MNLQRYSVDSTNLSSMGLKILAVGLILLGIGLCGTTIIPGIVTGLLIIVGAVGVLTGY